MKMYSKIVFWVIVYIASIGFILPELISAKSDMMVICGFILILVLIYRTITFIPIEKVKKFIKEMFN